MQRENIQSISIKEYSFTVFRGKSIYSKSYMIEIWLFLLVQEMNRFTKWPFCLSSARNHWCNNVNYHDTGCIDPELDRHICNEEQLKLILSLCENIQLKLGTFGEKIPKEFLNSLNVYKHYNKIIFDNDAEIYLRYGRALIRLLKGEQNNECENA